MSKLVTSATPLEKVEYFRRGDGLAGKRLVIWVFAARELAAGQGWKRVPVVP